MRQHQQVKAKINADGFNHKRVFQRFRRAQRGALSLRSELFSGDLHAAYPPRRGGKKKLYIMPASGFPQTEIPLVGSGFEQPAWQR